MAIFGIIKSDDQVFTGDKIRFDCSESFVSPDVTFKSPISHEISTDGGVTWYNITLKKYVDWIFTTSGSKTITLRLTDSSDNQETFTKVVSVSSLSTANLFSKDVDLYKYEPEIDQYLPKKWSSWNMIHLEAQKFLLNWLDEKQYFNQDGESYEAQDIMSIEQVREISTFKALEIIFAGNSNVVGDIFSIKRDKYKELFNEKASRSYLKLDYNNNGTIEQEDSTSLNSIRILRR